MIQVKNKKRCGFVANDHVMVRCNESGRNFYRHSKPGKIFFNLPPGNWTINGNAIQTLPHKYEDRIKLPTPERFFYPKNYKVVKVPDDVTSTGYINHGSKKIFLNENLENEKKDFVLFHELGHRNYSTEWKCDVYAAKRMLEKGYNPSQVLNASDALERQPGRVRMIFDKFIKNFAK